MANIIFDIETGPLPEDVLIDRIPPYEPPPPPGAFDPGAVKIGNAKAAEKIREKIADARAKHELEAEAYPEIVEKGRAAHLEKHKEKAALSPLTGQVLAIGYLDAETEECVLDTIDNGTVSGEGYLLTRFWDRVADGFDAGTSFIGHNIAGFDIPFLVQRSWLLGLKVPAGLYQRSRYLDDRLFVDTMQIWACGRRDFVKLDTLARAMGVGQKMEGVDGSMFAFLFAEDKPKALEYLKIDLETTLAVAERMGVC